MLVGLTGRRRVGKSEAARILTSQHGFQRVHPFDGGKAMCRTYFERLGATAEAAERMTDGDLKDIPSPLLPGQQSPRYFMERFGKFMGTSLGPEWTIGVELDMKIRQSDRLVVESVVYEAEAIRARGGVIIRVVRPGVDTVEALETDRHEALITADHTVVNDGSFAELADKLARLLKL